MADSVVRARIAGDVKEEAARVLAAMGLSVSDAIRMLLIRVARERALPFDVKVPNHGTPAETTELDGGKDRLAAGVAALMAELKVDE